MKKIIKIKIGQSRVPTYVCLTLLTFLILSSCKKFIQIDLPNTQITGQAVFEDPATANAAMADIYIKLREYNGILSGDPNKSISFLLSLYADEVDNPRADNIGYTPYSQNNLLQDDTRISQSWSYCYNLIYAANAIIEGLDKSTKIAAADKNRIQGEALFVRAYLHFYLLNLFGPIPYITTTDYRTNTTVARMTSEVVYANIITDLKQAKALIPDAYLSSERTRPNKGVVSAMLARVYLYNKNWVDAEASAAEVINNGQYVWVDNLDNVFLKESTGTLWQFKPNIAGGNAYEGALFNNNFPITTRLLAAFESNDLRKTHWLRTQDGLYIAYKYKQRQATPTSLEYSIMFRLEEQYLIRAEARAMKGNISGSQDDLNKIRHRAGLGDTPANSELTLTDAILKERRVELFTELGHRFFDLKRTANANTYLSYKPNWTNTDLLWPLPQSELLLNPSLKPQNPGYDQ